jgi:hypothetical protein
MATRAPSSIQQNNRNSLSSAPHIFMWKMTLLSASLFKHQMEQVGFVVDLAHTGVKGWSSYTAGNMTWLCSIISCQN